MTAAAAAGLVLLYALRNGTYDLVTRGELGVLIWLVLGVGWLSGVLPREKPARALWPVVAGFALLAMWTTICLRWTSSDERTVVEIGRVVHHAGVFLLAASLLKRRTAPAAVAGLTLGAVVVCWLGLLNWLWPQSIATDDVRTVLNAHRLNYPLDYWNGMAALGSMATVASLAWASHARSAVLRTLAAVPIPGLAMTVYLTYSRGGFFEMAIGLIVLLIAARNRWPLLLTGLVLAAASAFAIVFVRDHQQLVQGTGSLGAGSLLLILVAGGALGGFVAFVLRAAKADERLRVPQRAAVPAIGLAAFALGVAAPVVGPEVADRAKSSFESQEVGSATDPTARFANLGGGRRDQFAAAVDAWHDRPVEGIGPGTYEFAWNRSPLYRGFVRDTHSLYLEVLAESGVPGLLALLLVLVSSLVIAVLAAMRARDAPARGAAAAGLAMFAVFLFAVGIDWMWELTAVAFVSLLALGALAAGLGSDGQRRRLRASRVLVPIGAILAVLVLLPPVVSQSQIRESQASVRANDLTEALRHADDAIGTAPWSATAMAQKSLVLEQAGQFASAEAYAALAIERERLNWRFALLRSRLLATRGDTRRALTWFRKARALAPRNPRLR